MSKNLLAVLVVCILLLAAGALLFAKAESAGIEFAIPWWSIDGGGGTSSGGTFTLSGTIGQPDAGCAFSSDYKLTSGFWRGCPFSKTFLPLVMR